MEGPGISAITIYPFDTRTAGGKTLAMAEVVLGGAIRIRGVRILQAPSGGLFLGMPSVRGRDGRFREQVSLVDAGFARHFRERVLEAYRRHEGS